MIAKFYNFMVFALLQRNIDHSHQIDNSKPVTAATLSMLHVLCFALFLFLTSYLGKFNLGVLKLISPLIVLAIFGINYYRCVKSNYLDSIKLQFEGTEMDTQRNRKVALWLAFLFIIISIFLIISLSYINSL